MFYINNLTNNDDVKTIASLGAFSVIGLTPNRHFCGDILVGNILILGSRGEHLCGLSEKNIEKYTEQFREPEVLDPEDVAMFMEAWFF